MKVPSPEAQRRVDALALYDIMDTPPDREFDAIVMRACELCATPIATVTFLDAHRQWFKARVGLDATETPIEHAFCAHTILQPREIMLVPDARDDGRFSTNPYVTDGPLIRFYAGVPLVTPDGVPIGTLCVVDCAPRVLSPSQLDELRVLAGEAMVLLESHRWQAILHTERAAYRALQTSEAYFRHLTEFALDLITILEPNGVIRFESRSIERELGYAPAHYRGRNAFEFVHPDDTEMVMKAFADMLQHGGNTPVIRFRFQHADGDYRVLEGSGNNLLDDPAVRGIVFNSRDVTDRLYLQEEIEHARQEKEDTVARLTGGVAHDFNNILTMVQGFAELTAARVPADSTEAGYLEEIKAATRRAADLTQQLLAVSRRVVLQRRAIELNRWLRMLEPRLLTILGPEIELFLVSEGHLQIWEDPAQLEQVLMHLTANAREALPYGGQVTIEVSPVALGPAERPPGGREGNSSYVRLRISDDGCGMSEEVLARIFEPFFSTKTTGNHPGLGLSMCRGIIEQSGGHLKVSSEPGEGTVFDLYLQTAEAIEEEIPALPAPAPATDFTTILFVDDEPMLREIGHTILEDSGYRVIIAEDGPDALARLAELGSENLDLLITDVVMPGMSGVQLAEEVQRQRSNIRTLLCSGYTRDALAQSGGVPPGIAFLPKPYSLSALLEKVSELTTTAA